MSGTTEVLARESRSKERRPIAEGEHKVECRSTCVIGSFSVLHLLL